MTSSNTWRSFVISEPICVGPTFHSNRVSPCPLIRARWVSPPPSHRLATANERSGEVTSVLGTRECRQSTPAASCRSSVQLCAERSEPGKVETSDVRRKALPLCACAVWKYGIAFVVVCLGFRLGRNGRSKKETGMLAVWFHRCT